MKTISAVYARYVVRDFSQRGLDENALLTGTGLSLDTLLHVDAIDVEQFNTLLTNALHISGDPSIGLMIGRNTSTLTLGTVGVAAASAPSLRAGLRALESFARVHAQHTRLELRAELDGLRIELKWDTELGEIGRLYAESGVLWLQQHVELVSGRRMESARVCMGFPRPRYADKYPDYFHCPVSFGHQETSLQLHVHCLDQPSPYYNRELWQRSQIALDASLRDLSRVHMQSYSHFIRNLLDSSAPPLPSLADLAQELHISERTLNRRLNAEGSSFRSIRTAVLSDWARRYLLETRDSVESIAERLGFQDPSNFRRAFRSWEHCAPNEFRERASTATVAESNALR